MKEIGGYIELDTYTLPMLHERALALNCGRNCLAYLLRARNIKKIALPYFLCNSVRDVCIREKIEIQYYHIGLNFMPLDVRLDEDEWIYIVNYYGQLSNSILEEMFHKYEKVIVDNAQAYFQMPVKGLDTLYTCRKFFGVTDGAFLYTDTILEEEFSRDESYERMHFLLGRFERSASEFYQEYADNNCFFVKEPIKYMSKLTENLLHGIDYEMVKKRRRDNFCYLHEAFEKVNKLELVFPDGPFMYPLYINGGAEIRKRLIREKIYIPLLWPDVHNMNEASERECDMADDILPLPLDQRYDSKDMDYVIKCIHSIMDGEV